ncbi:tRNA methyl transferase-like protein [Solidesulfovibrio fructosivorans JJ]]|uniref:tRNA-uridine 2-sulfurtransferase n=1 Tax=Solidesulfovibrio fructosivorans JJ] TaxID=596151 RepID=E1JX85_SOLFR|nr:tRNA-specific 2-thiouridylase [Solidesulfovibrio fructosivorans]EFL51050.1 tRNA methyl transferase-like protein [Solidesulfovibrio fructosivorans JJ]]
MRFLAVAASGGADSLLALGLLQKEGHGVFAIHAHFLPPDDKQQQLADAIAAQCEAIGVPFQAIDLSDAFRARVIAPFIAAYVAGETPNPCAACNRDLKFGLLAEAAISLGADKIATGHYAGLADTPEGAALFRGADATRDQSYFLSLVPQSALARALFPLARRKKADNPEALAALDLAPPLPRESREVCFVPGDDYRAFLEASGVPLSGPGPIALPDGTILGAHQGLWRHTIGQRKGLGVGWREPLYVLAKDAAANTLRVGPKQDLLAASCRAREVNVLVPPRDWPETVLGQTCYRMAPRPARAAIAADGSLDIVFEAPLPRPTPGQVATLYDAAGRVLAGGVIVA